MNERLITFGRDIFSYHISLIDEGVRHYFSSENRSASYVPFDVAELEDFGVKVNGNHLGVIGWYQTEGATKYISSRSIPYLNLFECQDMSNVGLKVFFKGEGTMAAKFFIEELKCENLGFVGLDSVSSNLRRLKEFEEIAHSHGLQVNSFLEKGPHRSEHAYYTRDSIVRQDRRTGYHNLIAGLKKPAAIFCANDRIALVVATYAERMGFSVPEMVNILGVGSIDRADEGHVASVSVIQLDHVRQGFVSAQLMEQFLIDGIPTSPIHLEPSGILHRSTTLRRNSSDPLIKEAILLIQNNNQICVEELCLKLGTSRRTLENRFHNATNMTIAKAIEFERFCMAKILMRKYPYSLASIAGLAGYNSGDQMRRSFYRFAHMSPSQFCRLHQSNTIGNSDSDES